MCVCRTSTESTESGNACFLDKELTMPAPAGGGFEGVVLSSGFVISCSLHSPSKRKPRMNCLPFYEERSRKYTRHLTILSTSLRPLICRIQGLIAAGLRLLWPLGTRCGRWVRAVSDSGAGKRLPYFPCGWAHCHLARTEVWRRLWKAGHRINGVRICQPSR